MPPSWQERNWMRTHGLSPTVDEFNALKELRELECELRLDEERIADQMTADELRGITAPEY